MEAAAAAWQDKERACQIISNMFSFVTLLGRGFSLGQKKKKKTRSDEREIIKARCCEWDRCSSSVRDGMGYDDASKN